MGGKEGQCPIRAEYEKFLIEKGEFPRREYVLIGIVPCSNMLILFSAGVNLIFL